MKQYLLFAGDRYYAVGGFFDFKGSFETVEEAMNEENKNHHSWYHIFDSKSNKIVEGESGGFGYYDDPEDGGAVKHLNEMI